MSRIDIGNVRGIKGEKGDRGEQGRTPSYDDLKYAKQNDRFVTLKGTGNISESGYYLDKNGNLCNSEGYILDENYDATDELGEKFDIDEYGYEYKQLWKDEENNFTNEFGELLDEEWNVKYVESDFISDVTNYIYTDQVAYNQLILDMCPHITDALISADPSDPSFQSFFDEIEGNVNYYICANNPKNNIYIDEVSGDLVNTCHYVDSEGITVVDGGGNPISVPLEKNALYLYNNPLINDSETMHYDIYVCTYAGTVPKILVSTNDFVKDYNVIDDFTLTTTQSDEDEDDYDVYLNLVTKGNYGEFYNKTDIDTMFANTIPMEITYANNTTETYNIVIYNYDESEEN